ncbi:peptidoglycan editing factor PgeF [Limnofasciculus baicalensis]|uniref:Purine nucleoside phosphorylase n=1 Tax=Limnofasciculus baicalensis BBK-W-15 TaxID=2699891 RepID=A0AAE3GX20_9CYAN|nr:peptidoglycan editing factor PgeF [Limnofasciculus baicalensis]MCP2731358.1 peptidoglycan editing factor PgeF [Limnofasciculus baicalensis BBK-W-15]
MNTWKWQTWDDLPYLTSSLLEPWQHGFFTQHFSPRLPDTISISLKPDAKVYRVKQVHGSTVLTPSEIERAIPDENGSDVDLSRPLADGILSQESQQSVWVCTADCTPVLIGDTKTGRVAAIHAGWRGTAGRIVPVAIAKLIESGSSLADLRVAMGPAIAGEVYQVASEVAAEVGASIIPPDKADSPESILNFLQQLPDSPILEDSEPGKVRLDVRRVNAIQLEQLGLDAAQIAIAPHCTYQEPEHFFSYRRDKLKKVQWSGIVSN